MAKTNGLPDANDELVLKALIAKTTEPQTFEFQSDLSDDDGPDPLALDEIANASLALSTALEGQERGGSEPQPVKQVVERQINGNDSSPTTESEMTQPKGVRFVDIEVTLPWLPPAKRAGYQYVKVEEYDYHRERRKRYVVSHTFLYCFHVETLSWHTSCCAGPRCKRA
ncbi:hypothetical protein VTK26DRAFT_2606 [Humicola hyalothermophila]